MMLQLPSVRAQAPAQSAPRRAARAPAPALPSSRTQCSRRGSRLRAALLQPVTEPESLPSPLERRAASPVDDRWPTAPPDGAELRSTPAHKAVVGAWFLTLAAAAAHCAVDAQTAGLPAELVALLLSYVAADLGSGVFHWSTDNYGDRSTPLVGSIIYSFQGHHRFPRTITLREFSNNVSGLCATTLLPLLLTTSLDIPPLLRTFLTVFIGLVTMSQQTHAWSHSLPSETPAVVQLLQDAGLIISRKAHGAHHLPPFEGNYCIVSGICNPLLDGGLTKSWERKIFDMNGVAPRSWDTEGH